MKLLFLDFDGVLNDHYIPDGVSCGLIYWEKIQLVNHILRNTGAKIVVSSAWRYLIHRGEMNLKGLSWLLQSHGLLADSLIGITDKDTDPKDWDGNPSSWVHTNERGQQISTWLAFCDEPVERYVVIDDLDLGITDHKHPFLHVDGTTGLRKEQADEVIKVLNMEVDVPYPRLTTSVGRQYILSNGIYI